MMQSRLHSFQFKIEPAEASAKPTGAEPFVSRGRSKQRSFLWFVPRFREGSISSMGIISLPSLLLERGKGKGKDSRIHKIGFKIHMMEILPYHSIGERPLKFYGPWFSREPTAERVAMVKKVAK
jgi:hypothetical protein